MFALRVAIIGGGFSGSALAYHLMEVAPGAGAVAIDVVEPREELGAGIAYGDARETDRLNVPAHRMILDRGDPDAFVRWLTQRDAGDAATYAPRRLFAGFVRDELARRVATCRVRLVHHRTSAVRLVPDGANLLVRCADNSAIRADAAVLCTGHERPALIAQLAHLADHPAIVSDPWQANALDRIAPDARVLIVGTALTAADVVVALRARGHQGPVLAVSRRGLLPRRGGPFPNTRGDFTEAAQSGVAALLRNIRREVRSAEQCGESERGESWRAVLWALREQNGAIWQGWSAGQRSRFLRHLRPFWDVHRFQMAPRVADILDQTSQRGALQIAAARIVDARADGAEIAITLQRRGCTLPDAEDRRFDAVVNCTGGARVPTGNGLIRTLLADGIARPDPHGLGLEVAADGRLIGSAGRAHALFAMGALARGGLGEVSGASEIADHAKRLAEEISRLAIGRRGRPRRHMDKAEKA